jgi:subtilisin family serine protease
VSILNVVVMIEYSTLEGAPTQRMLTYRYGLRAAAPGVKGPDIAGPGVDVYSYTISGTSMATRHVARIAALFFPRMRSGARGYP